MSLSYSSRRAFTLIELLIVIAIVAIINPSEPFHFSASSAGPLNGTLDEIRLYRRALGASAVEQFYKATR